MAVSDARGVDAGATLWLVCLCAAWCRTCDAYAEVLEAVGAEFRAAAPALQVRWVDIEDDADWLGDVDVETFPTLLVADRERVRFYGPLTPQPQTLRRVLRAAIEAPAAVDVGGAAGLLAERIRERWPAE
jgi:thioredoxin 1